MRSTLRVPRGRATRRIGQALAAGVVLTLASAATATAAPPSPTSPTDPDLGPGTIVFDPSMPTDEIQATVDAIHARQVSAEIVAARPEVA